MKTDEFLIVGAAGLLVFMILRSRGGAGGSISIGEPLTLWNKAVEKVSEIVNTALPGQPGAGWRYFDDGTVISPDGSYYLNGQLVWTPPSGGASGGW